MRLCGSMVEDSGLHIELAPVKHLNNIVEQDHRAIKLRLRPMMGFKSFWSTRRIIAGIETMYMIAKRQMNCPSGQVLPAAQQFYSLAFRLSRRQGGQLPTRALNATKPEYALIVSSASFCRRCEPRPGQHVLQVMLRLLALLSNSHWTASRFFKMPSKNAVRQLLGPLVAICIITMLANDLLPLRNSGIQAHLLSQFTTNGCCKLLVLHLVNRLVQVMRHTRPAFR